MRGVEAGDGAVEVGEGLGAGAAAGRDAGADQGRGRGRVAAALAVEVELAGVALGGGEQDGLGVRLLAGGGEGGGGPQLEAEDAEKLPVEDVRALDGGPLLREALPGAAAAALVEVAEGLDDEGEHVLEVEAVLRPAADRGVDAVAGALAVRVLGRVAGRHLQRRALELVAAVRVRHPRLPIGLLAYATGAAAMTLAQSLTAIVVHQPAPGSLLAAPPASRISSGNSAS